MVPDMAVFGVRSLAQVVAAPARRGDPRGAAGRAAGLARRCCPGAAGPARSRLDMADVRGMADARFALEVAAAGGHHLMLSGPKGAGKTTLAERIPSLLPDLTLEQSLELTAVHSLPGGLAAGETLITRPPFRAPHHSASRSQHPRRRHRPGPARAR